MTKDNSHLDKQIFSAREDYISDEGYEDMFCFDHKFTYLLMEGNNSRKNT